MQTIVSTAFRRLLLILSYVVSSLARFERVMMRLQSEYVSVNSIPIENIHEAVGACLREKCKYGKYC